IKSIACLSEEEQAFKDKRDQELRDVITGKDQRFLLVIGPCSADNEEAVLEYAKKLAAIKKKSKIKFSSFNVCILVNHVPMAMVIKECYTNKSQMAKRI